MISFPDLVVVPTTFAAAEASMFMKVIENSIWVGIAVCAFVGMYSGILLMHRVRQKRFPGAEAEQAFLDDVGERLEKQDFEGAAEVCDDPAVWNRTLAQLALVAIQNRSQPMKKIRQIVGERFERDILASLDVMNSWVGHCDQNQPAAGTAGHCIGDDQCVCGARRCCGIRG